MLNNIKRSFGNTATKVKRKAMISNWYNQIPHPALKTKREITKYIIWRQFTKSTRVKQNDSSFPNRWSFSYLKFTKYVTNIIAESRYKYGQQEQVTIRNHNRSTALERSKYKNTGGLKPVLRAPNLALSFYHGSKHTVVRSAWRFSNSSMDHHVKQINHR